jgi:hypothetical protein
MATGRRLATTRTGPFRDTTLYEAGLDTQRLEVRAISELQCVAGLKIHDGKLDELKRLAAKCAELMRTKDTGRAGRHGPDATRVASYNPFVPLYWMTTGKDARRSGALSRLAAGDQLKERAKRLAKSGFHEHDPAAAMQRKPQIYLLDPYDPNKTPLLMVHGLQSTSVAFATLARAMRPSESMWISRNMPVAEFRMRPSSER